MTMSTAEGTTSPRTLRPAGVATTLLLVLFYLHVSLLVDPRLVHHQHFPVFLTGRDFLKDFLVRPGGPAGYVSTFLLLFAYYRWCGAAVITAVAGLMCLATRAFLNAATGRRTRPEVYLVPAVLLLVQYNQYNVRMVSGVAVLAVLGLALVYVRLPVRGPALRLTTFLVLSVVLYYVAGGMVFLFGVLCGVHEIVERRRVLPGVVCITVTAVLPAVWAAYSFGVGLGGAYVPLPPFAGEGAPTPGEVLALPTLLDMAFVVFFPVASVLTSSQGGVTAFRRAVRRVAASVRRRLSGRRDAPAAPPTPGPTGPTVRSVGLFLVVSTCLVLVSLNRGVKARLELGFCAYHQRWERVLEIVGRLPSRLYDPLAMHDVNRALYEVGRLPGGMFAYPQKAEADSLFLSTLQSQSFQPTYLKSSGLFFEMGQVNAAQRAAHMALEAYGELPEVLKLLVKINVVKGRPTVARSFLATLERNPLCRGWVEDFRGRLDVDPTLASDEELVRVRSRMVTTDAGWQGVWIGGHCETMLEELLKTNPKNRMAFEYLMAHFLLTKQLDGIVARIGRLNDFDYDGIPRYYEEAILLYEGAHPDRKIDLHGRSVSSETRQRFRDYARYYVPYHVAAGVQRKRAFEALRRNMGDSYFFYYTANFSVRRVGFDYTDTTTGATR
ncbi:MAG TPA: DUF6057 family protein [Planctomycetota bacterium]|nr:DUF6057 family protein [Planctomycetota bacterium]